MSGTAISQGVATYCPLCVSRCGAIATVQDGELIALGPDPSHPTGQALCTKGKAAPEIVAAPDRLSAPLRRTTPKDADDPGWEEITWDEALDTIAERLLVLRGEHGAETVAFSTTSPSTSAIVDALDWVMRLRRAFGSPNQLVYMELCGWGRYFSSMFTFGVAVPGVFMPDIENAGCVLYWGYNPSVSRLAHATATVAATRRGAKLVVVDPRRAGLATRADHWLRVRPGTDAALALAITHVMLEQRWFDDDFIRRWTNAPFLVRDDTRRMLRADELPGSDTAEDGRNDGYIAWDRQDGTPVVVNRSGAIDPARLELFGAFDVDTVTGAVTCRTVLDLVAEGCRAMEPATAEALTGVPAAQIEEAARTLWESRPVAFYTWSGLEQHSSTTQIMRAIQQLYALTGSFDAPGGNVAFTQVPTNAVDGAELLPAGQRAKTVGLEGRPLSAARFEFVTGEDLWRAILDAKPYQVRGLMNFGANLTMAHGDSARVRDALASLEFFVHADLFMNPTAEQADIVLPVTSAFEAEALKVGFEVSQEAASLVQLRAPLVAPRRGARSDIALVFDLAVRLGLAEHFFDGDVDAAYRHQLAPSGVTLEQLRADPAGVRVPTETVHKKYSLPATGTPAGFHTPSGRVELYSEELLDHGYPPLPVHDEPATSPRSRPDLADRFPLVLTNAKNLHFCETQHRNIPRLRSRSPDPELELHPDAAAPRGIEGGDWVRLETPHGAVRARARLNANLDSDVVVAQHGWWQGCEELDLPGYPPFGPDSANLNLVLRQGPSDPISGSSPLRASMCELALLDG